MVPPASHKVSRASWYSGFRLRIRFVLYTGLLPSVVKVSTSLLLQIVYDFAGPQPQCVHNVDTLVWALPRSLAATQGIDFSFSSSGYLDVSVPLVYLLLPMYSVIDT